MKKLSGRALKNTFSVMIEARVEDELNQHLFR
jgi:hypothetical protein